MCAMSIAPYFPFTRLNLTCQHVDPDIGLAWIEAQPDKRFKPLCHQCRNPADRMHEWRNRILRDLNLASTQVWIKLDYRRVVCRHCAGVFVEDLEFADPYERVTKRLALAIHDLCKTMTVKDVAQHFDLSWNAVKRIDKSFLEDQYGEPDYDGVRVLAVDEIAVRKGHEYMTVVIDYDTGRVLWMGSGRRQETLQSFFDSMTHEQREALEAIAMDMWKPYITAVQAAAPHVQIVFDLFHIMSNFGKVIDKVRNREYEKASEADKAVFKGSKYLLLKNRENITKPEHQEQLDKLMELNETICAVRILRDELAAIWDYRDPDEAGEILDAWCGMAQATEQPDVIKFAKTLQAHRAGILSHCEYPIHTSQLEGINNTIKVIKRKAYGFRDDRYFMLKAKQAFDKKDTP